MKLFTKYSRINVLATILIFLIASAAFYIALNIVLLNQIDEDLNIEKKEIVTYVNKYHRLPENIPVKDQVINYVPVNGDTKLTYSTSDIIQPGDSISADFRQLIFGIKPANQWYKVTVSKSLEDTDNLIHSVVVISFTTILVILLSSFFINRVVLKKLWRPFYQSLATVKEFKVSKTPRLQFDPSGIEEFEFMNQTLERITKQAQAEYIALKTFSENASHEIQTPIAIIRSKLDLLIQDEQLTEQQSNTLQSAYNALQKLTKLNQSLLLLAKIENNQYEEVEKINFKIKVESKLDDFQELWQAKKIVTHSSLEEVFLKMNPELADILLNNLLSNATKHNYDGGSLSVELNKSHFKISNTSSSGMLESEKLFQRFYRPSHTKDFNGLGLSIIKQICEASGFTKTYNHLDNLHTFTISFESTPVTMNA